jgi:hypothetical protein
MTTIFGRTWPAARVIVPYAGLALAMTAGAAAATSGLRAMRAASENLRLAVVMVPFLFVFCMGGAKVWGTRGAATGLAISGAIYTVLAWWLLLKVSRTFVPGVSEVVEDPVAEMAEP